jgi:hypothetical protein
VKTRNSEVRPIKSNQIKSNQMSAIEVVSPTADIRNATHDQDGLSFEVRECKWDPDCDHVYTPGSPDSPISPTYDHCIIPPLMRSTSSSITSPIAATTQSSSKPTFQCSSAMATADGMFAPQTSSSSESNDVIVSTPEEQQQEPPKDPNVTRLQLGENPETIALLHFLQSQGINTTKLVTQHMMKYASRVRIARTDEGKIIGCLIFDNETSMEELQAMSVEEAAQRTGPFIFLQLLVVAPEYALIASDRWKERLVESFKQCVIKNGKIAIIRAQADYDAEIAIYKSCGFMTMEDMGIPSYTSSKDNLEIMGYTPLGAEGTSEIFKKFYQMGARF